MEGQSPSQWPQWPDTSKSTTTRFSDTTDTALQQKSDVNSYSSSSVETESKFNNGNEMFRQEQDEEGEAMDWEPVFESPKVEEIQKMWHETFPSPISVRKSTASALNNQEQDARLVIVADTNIWIGYCELLKKLLETEFSQNMLPTLVIPWMVLQELDTKKVKGLNSPQVQRGAHTATKFMYQLLLSKHPRVIGQRASEAASSEDKFEPTNADDQILLCALQCTDRYPNSLIVVLTNDRNLSNKALIEAASGEGKCDTLMICDSTSTLAKIEEYYRKKLERNQRHIRVPKRGLVLRKSLSTDMENTTTVRTVPKSTVSSSSKPPKRQRNDELTESSSPAQGHRNYANPSKKQMRDWSVIPKCDTFESVQKLLQETFSHIIESQMKEDFGDTWEFALKIKPPWTLQSAVKCIIVHWLAVFSFVFGQRALVHAERLLEFIQAYNKLPFSSTSTAAASRKQSEEDIVELAISLLNAGKLNKSAIIRDGEASVCRQALMDYLDRNKV